MYHGKEQSLINSGRDDSIIITIETDSMTKAGHMILVAAMLGTIRTSKVGATLVMM